MEFRTGRAYSANGEHGNSIGVIIHKPIAEAVGLKAKDQVKMYTSDNRIVIEKVQ